eukprot:6148291-Pleurochrysis_carterae.AAC.1
MSIPAPKSSNSKCNLRKKSEGFPFHETPLEHQSHNAQDALQPKAHLSGSDVNKCAFMPMSLAEWEARRTTAGVGGGKSWGGACRCVPTQATV